MKQKLTKDEIAQVVDALHQTCKVPKAEAVGIAHVAVACERLQEKGIDPTNERIIGVLGKGSLSTISKGKREWLERQNSLRAAAAAAPAKSNKAIDLFEELWIEATRSGRQEATALKAQLDEITQKHRDEMIALESSIEAAERLADEQEAALKDRDQKSAQEREVLQAQVEKLTAALKVAEKRIADDVQKETGDFRSLANELLSELKAAKNEQKPI